MVWHLEVIASMILLKNSLLSLNPLHALFFLCNSIMFLQIIKASFSKKRCMD